jgi:flagellin
MPVDECEAGLAKMRKVAAGAKDYNHRPPSEADRTALNNEYKQLSNEVKRIAENTQWNGTNILDGARTATTFQIGANASQTVAVNFGDLATNNIADSGVVLGSATASADASNGAYFDVEITGVVSAGDVISVKVDDTHYATFELNAAAATALNHSGRAGTAQVTASDDYTANGIVEAGTLTSAGGALTATVVAGALRIEGATQDGSATFALSNAELSRGTNAPVGASDITTSALANAALGVLDTAIDNINSTRAGLGASMSRLEYASDNLQNISQNTASARSRVLDADYAAETTELARTQIIQQAATAMLAQANQSQQAVLSLLK